MAKFHKKAIFLLTAALLLTGCRATKKVTPSPAPVADPVVEEAPVATPKRTYTVMQFTGEVEGISVAGQLRMAEDSVMWLSVNKIIEVGRAMATPDSLWLRVPLMNRNDAMDYADLKRITGKTVTFDELQQIATAPDAEERIRRLAASLGFSADITITARRTVERLTFPFAKP